MMFVVILPSIRLPITVRYSSINMPAPKTVAAINRSENRAN